MDVDLGEALISVWRQVLVENASAVNIGGQSFPVQETPRSRLREVDFEFEGQRLRGLEQNPTTASNWARLARQGKKVMQFLIGGRYVANVVEGKVRFYEHEGRR